MNKGLIALACLTGAAIAQPAAAVVVVSSTGTITSTDPTQVGRVTRDGIASTWAAPKAYPGTFDTAAHNYDLVNATFSANAVQQVFYEISYTFTGTANPPFSVAYLNAFNPNNIATNYLGDSGSSPLSGGAAGSTITYQVIVGAGQQLLLNFHAVAGVPIDYSYTVSAFSDANRGENFPTAGVPEPSTWALMLLGFAMVGGAVRYRRKGTKLTFA